MRQIDVDTVIERAKSLRNVTQDQELAQALGVSRTTLSSWKRRGSIPAKYLLQMVDNGERTIDWLISGDDAKSADPAEIPIHEHYLDPEVLWLAILTYVLDITYNEDGDEELARVLTDDRLSRLHLDLSERITRLMMAKEKWLRSGLIKPDDVYKAVAVEAGLAWDFDRPHPRAPWLNAEFDESGETKQDK